MKIELNEDPGFETAGDDPLDQARHCFKKGRLEFMGGPVIYEQGHGYNGLMNQDRRRGFVPYAYGDDPESIKLKVDITG